MQIPGCTLCHIFYHFYFSWLECSLYPEISGGKCQYAKFGITCGKLLSLRPLCVIIQKKYKFANQKKTFKRFMDVVMHDIYQISLQNSPIGGQGLLFLKKKEQNVHVYIIFIFFCYALLFHHQENHSQASLFIIIYWNIYTIMYIVSML